MDRLFFKTSGFFAVLLYFLSLTVGYAQNKQTADSLIEQYRVGNYLGDELEILKGIAENETDQEQALEYSNLLIKKASKDSAFNYLSSGYLQKGNALQRKGDFIEAQKAYFKSLKYSRKVDDKKGVGAVMISIAATYSMIGNAPNAEKYYILGIGILREINDSIPLATALLNAVDNAYTNKKFEKALGYFKESAAIFKKIEYPVGIAYNMGNEGMVYAEQGKDKLAEQYINEAIGILEELEDYYPISVYLLYMADIYAKKEDLSAAFNFAERSLKLATQYGLKDQISEANLKLAQLFEKNGDFREAYQSYQQHINYRDSVTNLGTIQQLADLRTNFEVSQKQTEVDLLAQQKRTQKVIAIATAIALFLIVLLAIGLYRRNKFIRKTSEIIEREKNRSEELLLNILPEETAKELKNYGKVASQKFDSVSVLFTDFKDFTRYSEKVSPEILVESVDYYFTHFDDIIDKYGLEKIKTIGDAYMCAGGMSSNASKEHVINTILASIELAEFVEQSKENIDPKMIPFEVRIGINTGPVVAGVVGEKKFAYDIWGDTVNIASRMESNSEAGCINISENTYELIKDHFDCRYRGEIEVKNKGIMKMFYVHCAHKDLNLDVILNRAKHPKPHNHAMSSK